MGYIIVIARLPGIYGNVLEPPSDSGRGVDLQLPHTLTFEPPLCKCEKMEQDDRDEYVCSSSSADSIAGGSNDEDAYAEEIIEVEEGSELVLIPRREVRFTEIEGLR